MIFLEDNVVYVLVFNIFIRLDELIMIIVKFLGGKWGFRWFFFYGVK